LYLFDQANTKTTPAADLSQPQLNLGLILPHSIYNEREYNKAVAQTLTEIQVGNRATYGCPGLPVFLVQNTKNK
jgi:hypothetical protein